VNSPPLMLKQEAGDERREALLLRGPAKHQSLSERKPGVFCGAEAIYSFYRSNLFLFHHFSVISGPEDRGCGVN
jgi:hypothetical protein